MPDTSTTERKLQSPSKALNVLLVDDSPADLELAMVYLGKAWPFSSDMVVETAADGLEAMEKMRAQRFCLIILDWCLPNGGNGQVLREIRRNGVFIPVVVMSGLARDQLPDYLETAGAAYVSKDDMNASTLYCAIAEALRNCQNLRQSPSLPGCVVVPVLFREHDSVLIGG
ncbi:MAG: response regulator [Verrucomicrobiota bacterium]|jgi:CheY-like chemotaxis protein